VIGSDLPASQHGTTLDVFADERHSSSRSCLKEILACPPRQSLALSPCLRPGKTLKREQARSRYQAAESS
jgi:hypothetical protein